VTTSSTIPVIVDDEALAANEGSGVSR